MITSSHPDSELLLAFKDQPDDPQYQHVSLHLATCEACRAELLAFSSLINQISQGLPAAVSASSMSANTDYPQPWQIQAWLDKRLDASSDAEISRKLDSDKKLIKAALHQATHQAAMKVTLAPTKAPTTDHSGLFSRILTHTIESIARPLRLLQRQTPTWATAAVTAGLVLTVVISLPTTNHHMPQDHIVAYQDNPQVVFKQLDSNQPGIGFFNNIVTTSLPFADVSISHTESNTLVLRWPEIDSAKNYTVQVHHIHQGQWVLLQEKTVSSNLVKFDNLVLDDNVRYEWRITGETTDSRSFKSSGGFVFSQQN